MIAASLLVTGLLVVAPARARAGGGAGWVGVCRLHGVAHGYELAGSERLWTLAGMPATVLLHSAGLAAGWALRHRHVWLARAAGAGVAAFGGALLAQMGGFHDPRRTFTEPGEHLLNTGRRTPSTLVVRNTGDRPIQVGSHYHFAETNNALGFDRAAARGMRLNIASGTAVRFEPGQERTVELVDYAGERKVYGFQGPDAGRAEL